MENNGIQDSGTIRGGGTSESTVQISSNSTEGTTPDNGIIGTGVEEEVGVVNGDNQVSSQVQTEGISEERISEDEKALDDYVNASIGRNLAAYNALTIERKYSKAWNKFVKHCMNLANDSEQMDNETVMGLLLAAPRTVLPGFFDDNGIYVNTTIGHGSKKWGYDILHLNNRDVVINYGERVVAETEGFIRAFQILEEKL